MPPRRARSAAQASSGLPGSGTNRRARASRPGRRPRAPHQPDERPTVATNLCFETVNRLRCTKQLVIQPHYAHLGWRLNATRTSRKVFASTKSDLECPHPSPMCPTHDGRSLSTQAAAPAAIPLVIPQPRLTVLPKPPGPHGGRHGEKLWVGCLRPCTGPTVPWPQQSRSGLP